MADYGPTSVEEPNSGDDGSSLSWALLKGIIPGAAFLALFGDVLDNGAADKSTGVSYELPDGFAWLKEFLVDPTAFILETLLEFIVGGLITIAEIFIGAVQAAFEPLATIPGILGSAINDAVQPVAEAILWLPLTLEDLAIDLAASLGPWAPFVLVPLAVLLVLALYEGGTWLLNIISPRIATLIGE